MINIDELIQKAQQGEDVTGQFRDKSISVRPWEELEMEYDPSKHPVMDKNTYPDIVKYIEKVSDSELNDDGTPKVIRVASGEIEKVSRVTYDLQRLAVTRITELCFGLPVKRVYRTEDGNDEQKEAAKYLERMFGRSRIDSINIDRGRKLFASCEVMTLWYLVEQANNAYGFNSKYKLRSQTYSPMQGDTLYPLFDDSGDMVALSVAYRRKVVNEYVDYFDTYTSTRHFRWSSLDGSDGEGWNLDLDEDIKIAKIPAVYLYRPRPAWEDKSDVVYEMEWAMSRNGNYLRKNSRPILAAMVSEELQFGVAPSTDSAFRDIVQYPAGSSLQYVTWPQAIENLKFYTESLRQSFFTELQLPDWSYENMKTSPMSGEARKQLFIDCQLKVLDESGRWLEFFDREVNLFKAFLKIMWPGHDDAIDTLEVENVITPYTINDEKDTIQNLMLKNGGKPLCSQKESIEQLGESSDVDMTLKQIQEESMAAVMADALGMAE